MKSKSKCKPIVMSAVTVSLSAIFLEGQTDALNSRGYGHAILSSPGREIEALVKKEKVTWLCVPMKRDPSPLNDLISLVGVFNAIKQLKPSIVNAGTPKAGLLCMFAAWVLRVPVRIYTLHGFRHESLTGIRQMFQKKIERLTSALSTSVICVSPSVRQLGLEEGFFSREKSHVLNNGSCGIPLDKFDPEVFSTDEIIALGEELEIPRDSIVIGYIGRMIPRKGIEELVYSFQNLQNEFSNLVLLIVGDIEVSQPLSDDVLAIINTNPSILAVGFKSDVSKYYKLMSVFTLPAHWEGFGNVLVEAASMGLPIVTTNVTGCKDAVKDGYNGLVVEPKDIGSLVTGLRTYIIHSDLRKSHGANGIEWAKQFERSRIYNSLVDFYDEALVSIK